MRYTFLAAAFLVFKFHAPLFGVAPGKVDPPQIATPWGAKVSTNTPWAEYPRPQFKRAEWLNLNGQWEYGITYLDRTNDGAFSGRMLVPFPTESALSGVKRSINEQQRLWYRRNFTVPKNWAGRRIMLHFDAVDWETRVWMNKQELGTHKGGYDRFSFDVTEALKEQGQQELVISVRDPSQGYYQPRGKQKIASDGTFHSPSSGIWQTVWLEPVERSCIQNIKLLPDVDHGILTVMMMCQGPTEHVVAEAIAFGEGKEVVRANASAGQIIALKIPAPKLWSPASPFLYELKLSLRNGEKKLDEVESYFGMRKISVGLNKAGIPVLQLNNQPFFFFGVLDQGYWPDGIYTPPTDDALRSDVEAMKQFGFNTCRKHVKVEPDRWYYWCDKLGVLVWQDMPSGDRNPGPNEAEIQRRPESAAQFEAELAALVEGKCNHPCIIGWVPFGERRGQYDTPRILSWVKTLDPTRLVVSTGGPDLGTGDVELAQGFSGKGAVVRPRMLLCRGFEMAVAGHTWKTNLRQPARSKPLSKEDFLKYYKTLLSNLKAQRSFRGLSGAIFPHLSDVEGELDGLLTYDRMQKMDPRDVAPLTQTLVDPPTSKSN